MPHSLQNLPVNRIKLVNDLFLQLGIGHGFTVQQGLKIQAGRWNNIGALGAGYEPFVEEDRVALRVEPLKLVKGGENLCHFQRSKTIPVSAVYQPAFLNLLPLFFTLF